jgi:hypothetical protein
MEASFLKRLRQKLDPSIYVEKTSNRWLKGVPDLYVEGKGQILWVEGKYIAKKWLSNKGAGEICVSSSWPAQRRWLVRAHNNKQQTAVIVGVGTGRNLGGYILTFPFNFDVEHNQVLSLEHIAKYIENKVTADDNSTRETEG